MDRHTLRNILSIVVFSYDLVLTKEIIYKTSGSKVKLVCPIETTRDITWTGPPEYEVYAVGTDVSPHVSTLVKIKETDTDKKSILIVHRLTEDISGEFTCTDGINARDFNLVIKKYPSDLAIVNAKGGKITTVEGREHNLECTISSGKPGGNITWSTDGVVVATNGPSWVSYKLIPQRSDNGKLFICVAFNSEGERVLKSSVILEVFYIPKISFSPKQTLTVKENEHAQLICINDGNDQNATTVWKRQRTIVQNSCVLIFQNVKRTDAGLYTCIVDTTVGVYEDNARVIVLYNYAIVEPSLSGRSVVILSLVIIIAVLVVTGMGLYIRRLKQRYRERMEPAINVQTPEGTLGESAHYTEIIEIENLHHTSQENDDSTMSMTNRDIDVVSAEHTSTSSDNNRDSSEYLYDGYEKPYTTLVVTDQVKDEHVYLTTKKESDYENTIPFENIACGHACEFLEADFLSDKTKAQDDHEILNLNDDVNDLNVKYDSVPQTYTNPQMNKAEYINLSLNQ